MMYGGGGMVSDAMMYGGGGMVSDAMMMYEGDERRLI